MSSSLLKTKTVLVPWKPSQKARTLRHQTLQPPSHKTGLRLVPLCIAFLVYSGVPEVHRAWIGKNGLKPQSTDNNFDYPTV